ncbi:MAG: hypothetical protein A2583_07315 [Bdellovibrionales bacterium RIFOXYD1_FULL_53_11]|nr:MAG: hypothetical protein A2583_07315 [Bdellovibrionales bacterium RIFOXYD1_FULL_53_11]
MHTIFAAIRFFPYWGIPLAVVLGEIAWYFHRKRSIAQYYFWGLVGTLAVTTILWIVFRGDINSDEWTRQMLR